MRHFFFYFMMLAGFGYLSLTGPTLKDKTIGVLCLILNALIFWR